MLGSSSFHVNIPLYKGALVIFVAVVVVVFVLFVCLFVLVRRTLNSLLGKGSSLRTRVVFGRKIPNFRFLKDEKNI